jgi:hypothetical protein
LRIVEAGDAGGAVRSGVGLLAHAIRPTSNPNLHVHLISGPIRAASLRYAESHGQNQPTPPPYKRS